MNRNCYDCRRRYMENCRVIMCKIITSNTTDEDYPQMNNVILCIKAKVRLAVHIICNNRNLKHENACIHKKSYNVHICRSLIYKTHGYGYHNQPYIDRIMAVHQEQAVSVHVLIYRMIEHTEIIEEQTYNYYKIKNRAETESLWGKELGNTHDHLSQIYNREQ